MPLPTNGRTATQSDVQLLGQRFDHRFDKLDARLDDFGMRLRQVEHRVIEEQAHDDERELMLKQQADIKRDQGVSRRWLVGIAVTVALSLIASLASVLHLLS